MAPLPRLALPQCKLKCKPGTPVRVSPSGLCGFAVSPVERVGMVAVAARVGARLDEDTVLPICSTDAGDVGLSNWFVSAENDGAPSATHRPPPWPEFPHSPL